MKPTKIWAAVGIQYAAAAPAEEGFESFLSDVGVTAELGRPICSATAESSSFSSSSSWGRLRLLRNSEETINSGGFVGKKSNGSIDFFNNI